MRRRSYTPSPLSPWAGRARTGPGEVRIPAAALLIPVLVLLVAAPLRAQERPTGQASPDPASDTAALEEDRVSPLGAFLRAVVLPTWGHASVGSYDRGTFYMAAEGGTAFMLVRTRTRQNSAQRVLEIREARAREAAALAGITDPEELEAFLAEDRSVVDARNRVESRDGQFEDWVAMGVFLTLLSGADAFVSAHLRDFPDPIQVQAGPTPDGGFQVGARVPVGGRRTPRPSRASR